MFRGAPSDKTDKRLICAICGSTISPPKHHNQYMKWTLEGSFIKNEIFACQICGSRVEVPIHCGVRMLYVPGNVNDLPTFTSMDFELMRDSKKGFPTKNGKGV